MRTARQYAHEHHDLTRDPNGGEDGCSGSFHGYACDAATAAICAAQIDALRSVLEYPREGYDTGGAVEAAIAELERERT